jgi:Sulfotransferase domain
MGHLLGAPPRSSSVCANPVSAGSSRGCATWIEVDSLEFDAPDPATVTAFAIDQPRPSDRSPGTGLELNGWVIARDAPVRGIRTSSSGQQGIVHPLGVRRPDVAAEYPDNQHADFSGFSAWVPIDPRRRDWQIDVEGVLADGGTVGIAQIRGRVTDVPHVPNPGNRVIAAPDFVIIGAQRGGTTSLHAYLSAHPQVITPVTKELHFLTDRYERGLDWYLGQFPGEFPPGVITGEATPYALFHPLAPRRLLEIAPAAKSIVLVRNPVERAYSHFLLERSRGEESLDFTAALDAELERLDGEEARLARDPAYVSHPHKHASYVARGEYVRQLERWFGVFPRDQILVVRSEDLYERSAETFACVADFLAIDPDLNIPFTAHNQTSGSPLDPTIRRRLSEHFAPFNARLADLLGWDPGWR